MQTIQAIETSYRGYAFRSRAEARTAVFMDHCRIRWQYEPEGFDLGAAGFYLPDFWIPLPWCPKVITPEPLNNGYWLEVKPWSCGSEETRKWRAIVEATGHSLIVFNADWDAPMMRKVSREGKTCDVRASDWLDDIIRTPQAARRWWFGAFVSRFHGRVDLVDEAVSKARRARFEHGETPP